jgi:hypothetical protein
MAFSMGPSSLSSRRFKAAVRDPETGETYTGLDHMEAIDSAPDGVRERLEAIYRAPVEDPKSIGFMVEGKFISREDGLNALRDMRKRERQIADAYAKLDPVDQAVADSPNMEIPADVIPLGRMGAFKGTARELLEAARANLDAQRSMGKGFEAAARCAVRHGGSAAGRSFIMSGANAATQSTIMLGQALGLVAAVPATIAMAPVVARDARRISPQAREEAEAAYDIRTANEAALSAMERARGYSDVLGMDDPADPLKPPKPVPLNDVLDMRAPQDVGMDAPPPIADQDLLPSGGRSLGDSIAARDEPRPYTAPLAGSVTPAGNKVPPAPPDDVGPQDLTPPGEGQNLIDLFRPLIEGQDE